MGSSLDVCYREVSLDILLMGRTGDGKSATGNTLLGRESFVASASLDSVTTIGQYDLCDFEGYVIRVVDCPGLGDTKFDTHDDVSRIVHEITIAIANSPDGYNAFLFVFKYGKKFNEAYKTFVKTIKKILGSNILKNHCIIVMTCGDLFESDPENKDVSFDDWVQKQENTFFKKLVEQCQQRIILFDNRTHDCQKNRDQKRRLIEMINGPNSKMKRYTNEHFEKARKKREELIKKLSKEQNYDYCINIIAILMSRLQSATDDDSGAYLEKVKEDLDNLITKTKEDSKQNNLLGKINKLLEVFNEAVEAKTSLLEAMTELKQKQEQENEKDKNVIKDKESKANETFKLLETRYAQAKIYKHKNIITLILDFLRDVVHIN